MTATYEFWLTDDAGHRIDLLKDLFFASYTRRVSGYGSIQVGLSYTDFARMVQPTFQPDRRIEVWRSPQEDFPLRLEDIFLLRKPKYYTRETDAVQVAEFFGRSMIDLLRRRSVIQAAGTTYTSKTARIDDMMKAIVREQMLYGSVVGQTGVLDNTRAWPQFEFAVQADVSLGPSITKSFADRNVLEILEDLRDISIQKHADSASNRRIYFDIIQLGTHNFEIFILDTDFDVIEDESGIGVLDEQSFETSAESAFQFVTYADLRGTDRSDGLEFSEQNENLKAPSYSKDHLDEINFVYAKGQGEGASRQVAAVSDTARVNSSRWNLCEDVMEASNETTVGGLQDSGRGRLNENKPPEELYATFVNNPGSDRTPRSLYGLDWDLGDLLKVLYAGQIFTAEVMAVYVSIDENGVENVIGRNILE